MRLVDLLFAYIPLLLLAAVVALIALVLPGCASTPVSDGAIYTRMQFGGHKSQAGG